VIVCGGARKIDDFRDAVNKGDASAVAVASMFVFHGIKRAVLISYPEDEEIKNIFRKDRKSLSK
jgi:cyclase